VSLPAFACLLLIALPAELNPSFLHGAGYKWASYSHASTALAAFASALSVSIIVGAESAAKAAYADCFILYVHASPRLLATIAWRKTQIKPLTYGHLECHQHAAQYAKELRSHSAASKIACLLTVIENSFCIKVSFVE